MYVISTTLSRLYTATSPNAKAGQSTITKTFVLALKYRAHRYACLSGEVVSSKHGLLQVSLHI